LNRLDSTAFRLGSNVLTSGLGSAHIVNSVIALAFSALPLGVTDFWAVWGRRWFGDNRFPYFSIYTGRVNWDCDFILIAFRIRLELHQQLSPSIYTMPQYTIAFHFNLVFGGRVDGSA
jgi:hypothetical protein